MDEHRFQEIVAQLEHDIHAEPKSYRFNVGALALSMVGLFVLLPVVALTLLGAGLVALFNASLTSGIVLACAALLTFAVWRRTHAIHIQPPNGHALTREDAPELFKLIAKIRRKQRARAIDEVLVTDEYRVSIVRTPRFGPLGRRHVSLVIGLPFMLTTTREQFAAIVAHEYAHLTSAHNGFDAWVYRLRGDWARWSQALSRQPRGGFAWATWPIRSLVDYFQAYTFLIARDQEYEADQRAAAFAGRTATAQALVACSMGSRFYHGRFWPSFWARANNAPEPPELPFSAFRKHMKLLWTDASQLKPDLDAALAKTSTLTDTHPSLRDRLDALERAATLPTVPKLTAARALLGELTDTLTRRFDAQWHRDARESWAQRYEDVQNDRRTLGHLRSNGASLPVDELLRLATLEASYGDIKNAVEAFQRAIAMAPTLGKARLDYGRFLLACGDESGLDELDRAIEMDASLISEVTALGWTFCSRRGMTERAERIHQRFYQMHERHPQAA
ncbi:MAG TPA: M48 family metallopeptidase [Burkholderiaceae bacterium]|nr:M48 family metallopeptidase [Burkholderiaceae bacterium]